MNNFQSDSSAIDYMSILVRVIGIGVLLFGLYIGLKVISEIWELYDEPQRIERFADAIDQGSNLDTALAALTQTKSNVENGFTPNDNETLRISYFLAWFLVVLLLIVIGSIATSAIKTGGQLALYDIEVKRFARQLIAEAHKDNP